ncbi:MAG: hypothetical protein U1E36_08445 [Rickettsiales bacterium]
MADFFDDNLDTLNRFDVETRERLRLLSADIEREVARSLELVQKLEELRSAVTGEAAAPLPDFSTVSAGLGGDFLSRALESASARAASSAILTGQVNTRRTINAGARIIGGALGQSVANTIGRMRLSGSQLGQELSSQLLRGKRNS